MSLDLFKLISVEDIDSILWFSPRTLICKRLRLVIKKRKLPWSIIGLTRDGPLGFSWRKRAADAFIY